MNESSPQQHTRSIQHRFAKAASSATQASQLLLSPEARQTRGEGEVELMLLCCHSVDECELGVNLCARGDEFVD